MNYNKVLLKNTECCFKTNSILVLNNANDNNITRTILVDLYSIKISI